MFIARYGTSFTVPSFPVIKRSVVDFATSSDWTPATGDTKISKDGGNVANTTNNPSAVGGTGSALWTLTLTNTEMQAAKVTVQIIDSATKVIEDQSIVIVTLAPEAYDAIYGRTVSYQNIVPQVLSTLTQKFDSDTTSHAVTMPGTTYAGDLLIVLFANDGSATVTIPADWTQIDSTANGSACRFSSFAKIATGSEGGGTVDFVTSATEQAVSIVYRIAAGTFFPNTGTGITQGTAATGTSVSPNPPSKLPPWEASNGLFIACYGADDQAQATDYPANYTNGLTIQGTNTTGASVAAAQRILATSSAEDPGVFTCASQEWVAQTILIRPAQRDHVDVKKIDGVNVDPNVAQIGVNVVNYGGSAGTFSSGRPEVNTTHWGGTAVASAVVLNAANIGANAFTAAKFATGAFDAVWTVTTRLLTAGTNIVLAKGVGVTGFNDITAADVWASATRTLTSYGTLVADVATAVWSAVTRTLTAATNITSTGAAVPITAGGLVAADMQAVSTDATAADNFETMLDGTGGKELSLGKLNVVATTGDAIVAQSNGGNGVALKLRANGSGSALDALGGATGHGIKTQGGATSGHGIKTDGGSIGIGILATGGSTNGDGAEFVGGAGGGNGLYIEGTSNQEGLSIYGSGTGSAIKAEALGTGHGMELIGGPTGGDGLKSSAQGGNGLGMHVKGQGTGQGLKAEGGANGGGIWALGGLTSGDGFDATAQGAGTGFYCSGEDTGDGFLAEGGDNGGDGFRVFANNNGAGFRATGNGTGRDIVGELAALIDTARAESSGVPAANAAIYDKIIWMATLCRNKIVQTNTQQSLRNDADSADIATAQVSDVAAVATREEWV